MNRFQRFLAQLCGQSDPAAPPPPFSRGDVLSDGHIVGVCLGHGVEHGMQYIELLRVMPDTGPTVTQRFLDGRYGMFVRFASEEEIISLCRHTLAHLDRHIRTSP